MLDYRDIVEFVLATLRGNKHTIYNDYYHVKLAHYSPSLFTKLRDLEENLLELDKDDLECISSGSIVDLSKKNPFYGINGNVSIKEAIELIIQKGIDRINVIEASPPPNNFPIINEKLNKSTLTTLSKIQNEMEKNQMKRKDRVIGIISQIDIIKYLYDQV